MNRRKFLGSLLALTAAPVAAKLPVIEPVEREFFIDAYGVKWYLVGRAKCKDLELT